MGYRFTLEKYDRYKRNRYTCPSCGHKREFTRYIDTMGEFVFPEYVGKCNRINNCGYHYTPSDFFKENPDALKKVSEENPSNQPTTVVFNKQSPTLSQKIDQISKCVMHKSCNERWFSQNNLFLFLLSKIGIKETTRLFKEYNVGTAKNGMELPQFFGMSLLIGKYALEKLCFIIKMGIELRKDIPGSAGHIQN